MAATQERTSAPGDAGWLLVAVTTAGAGLLGTYRLLADPFWAGEGHSLVGLLWNGSLLVAYLVAVVWLVAGAWRRTSWGCRLAGTGECPRHPAGCRDLPLSASSADD